MPHRHLASLHGSGHRVAHAATQRTRRHRVREYTLEFEGLDPAHDGLRVAHLTDLHVGLVTPRDAVADAIDTARAAKPDVTFLTGDYVCYHPRYVPVLGELASRLGSPSVAVLGNHDHWTDGEAVQQALEGHGVAVLRNQHTTVTLRGAPLEVVGVDDAVTRQADPEAAFRGTRAGRGTRVVLTHAPGVAVHAARHGRALVLAGHTHGGQIHVRGVSDRLWAVAGRPYVKGFYAVGESVLYVNSGVGSSAVPLRAGAPSEVAIFTLRLPRTPLAPSR